MSVYVDPLTYYQGKGLWCHLFADNLEELHAFADQIGLKRAWFQDKPGHPHYDLKPSKHKLAVACGAKEVIHREMIRIFHENYPLR